MPDPLVDRFRELGRLRLFDVNEVLFFEGEVADSVFVVESGLVKVYVSAPSGDELILGLYGSGEVLGEMSGLGDGVRSATGIGHTPGRVTEIPGHRFRDFLDRHPDAMVHMLSVVQQRLRRADRERLSYLSDDVSGRVARKLVSWAHSHGSPRDDGTIVIARITRRELAQSVAASEKTVDDVLTILSAAGLIATGRRRFVLLDARRLQRWADDRRTR